MYFTDITSSEGVLSRYSDICRNLSFKTFSKFEIHSKIQDITYLSNEKVRNRHIFIMNKLDLLSEIRSDNSFNYYLGPYGKILKALDLQNRKKIRDLDVKEKIIFLETINNHISTQFNLFINNIYQNQGINRNSIIIDFFDKSTKYNIWDNNTIKKGIISWKIENNIIRSFENRFGCIEMWAEDLNLIKKDKNTIKITKKGSNYINSNDVDEITLKIYCDKRLKEYDVNKNYNIVKNLFVEYYNKLIEPTSFADLPAIFKLIQIDLAINYGILLKSKYHQTILSELWKENIITSISNDNKGQLRYVVLKS